MSSEFARTVSLLTLSLLVSTTGIASASDLDPEWQLQASLGGAPAEDASARDAGTGGSSSPSTAAANTGGAEKSAGTREMEGPDMSACTCRTLSGRQSTPTGFGLLLLAAVGALLRVGARR